MKMMGVMDFSWRWRALCYTIIREKPGVPYLGQWSLRKHQIALFENVCWSYGFIKKNKTKRKTFYFHIQNINIKAKYWESCINTCLPCWYIRLVHQYSSMFTIEDIDGIGLDVAYWIEFYDWMNTMHNNEDEEEEKNSYLLIIL